MAHRFIVVTISLWAFAASTMAFASAKEIVALVIGNSDYEHTAHLDNPQNDANDVADEFERLGFTVHRHTDLDHRGMRRAVRKFARALQGARAGVFFYAGHGLQVSGTNYLVPVDAKLEEQTGIDFELIRLDLIHRTMEKSTKTNILFLDACRDNPLVRSLARSMGTRSVALSRGLARMESGVGSLISFSTQPGNVAVDGSGDRNSPYAEALLKHLKRGENEIFDLLIKVRRDVIAATDGRQVPWEHSALTNEFAFRTVAPAAVPQSVTPLAKSKPKTSAPETRAPAPSRQAEIAFWNTIRASNDPDLIRAYLDQYPKGSFARLAKVMLRKLEKKAKPDTPLTQPPRVKRKTSKTPPRKKKATTRSKKKTRKAVRTIVRRRRKKTCRFETNFECLKRGGIVKYGRCKDPREVCS